MNIGIDLGSSNTVVATILSDGTAIIIPDYIETNSETTPSLVLLDNKKAIVGTLVKNVFQKKAKLKVLSFFKRYFGTNIPVDTLDNKAIFSEGIAAILLKKVMFDVKMFNNQPIDSVVITVPSHYDSNQRNSVLEAAKLAGVKLSAIIDEPIAAALYYLSESDIKNEELILVYDLGGGTFDMSVITSSGDKMHIIAKGGISDLGGKEFDEIIIKIIKQNFLEVTGKSIKENAYNDNLLNILAERIKIKIDKSESDFSEWVFIDNVFFPNFISKAQYENLANELILKTVDCVEKSLRSLGLTIDSLQKVILIGGASNSKLVYDFWRQKLSPEQSLIYHQPLTSVAKGAAIYAHNLNGKSQYDSKQIELKSVSTYNIGIKLYGQEKIEHCIIKNSPLPCSHGKTFGVNLSQSRTVFVLVRFFDLGDSVQELGEIVIDNEQLSSVCKELKIVIENKEDGTLGINVYDSYNDKKVKYSFNNYQSKRNYNFEEQLQLLNQIQINNLS